MEHVHDDGIVHVFDTSRKKNTRCPIACSLREHKHTDPRALTHKSNDVDICVLWQMENCLSGTSAKKNRLCETYNDPNADKFVCPRF